MNKKLASIILLIVTIIFIFAITLISVYQTNANRKKAEEKKQADFLQIASPLDSLLGKDVFTTASTTDPVASSTNPKIEAEIKKAIENKRAECISNPENMEINESIRIDREKDLLTCLAVQNNDSGKCLPLKNDPESYRYCTDNTAGFLKMVFPIFRDRTCQGLDNKDDQSFCQAVILNKPDECEKISDRMQRTLCEALGKKDIKKCESLNEFVDNSSDQEKANTDRSCTNAYYLVMGLKENDMKYFDLITNGLEYAVGNLYFDGTKSCETMLARFRQAGCEQISLTQQERKAIEERYRNYLAQ